MERLMQAAGQKALELAARKNIAAEAFILYNRELSIEVVNGQVENLKEADEMGLGIRVFNQGKIGFAYSSDLSDAAVEGAVNDAAAISAFTSADEYNRLVKGNFIYPQLMTYDNQIAVTSLEDKIEMARELERAAKNYDRRITVIERAGYEDSEFASLVMNSEGIYAFGRANFSGIYISLVAQEDNDAQTGFAVMVKKKISDLVTDEVGQEAAMRAVRSLKAKNIGSARLPCVMEPYVVTRFLGILSQLVSADAVQKGKSMLAGRQGQVVAAQVFNLVDDATCQEGIASFPFDGEGVAAQRNVVIENGVLKGYLYDTYTAAKAGVKSTGNGYRDSFRSLPSVNTTNFMVNPGNIHPDKLIGEIEKGFYITDVMGMHTANPISGEFSVGAAGIMIEKGQLTYPVRGVTISGNLGSFLKDIEAVGSDVRFYGGKAAPSIRLKSLSIGGE
ncbi:MAG: TldD/PmbA family protein [Syntrophomonadaceae bacterium]|jgi:PmbA protein